MILALNPGGNTFYFGPVGDNGSAVVDYFAKRGFECPPEKNVAEFILETAAKSRRRPDGTKVDWNAEWRNSSNAKNLLDDIHQLKSERSKVPPSSTKSNHEFAAPVWTQTTELTTRVFRQHWRDPSYYYGKIFVAVIFGIFNGFTFWQSANTVQDMQNRMFSVFLIITIAPPVLNAVMPKFFQNLMLWQGARVSFPHLWLVRFHHRAGRHRDTHGHPYRLPLLGSVWITAFAPNFTVIANVLPFFLVMFSLFNGVVRPYEQMSVFWRYWMYYINPSTYWIQGVLAATLNGIPVRCAESETAKFTPPQGVSCETYAGNFANTTGGYFLDPANTTLCEFCPYTVGNQYLSTLHVSAGEKWRDFGIFCIFVVSNWALVYFFTYNRQDQGVEFRHGLAVRDDGERGGRCQGVVLAEGEEE
ncbi:hypothetical protein MRB53_038006 [Persea americana]|nr:hypothetical protein MRB53_038006 [Persea americana]